jgi:hypothetical protein
MKPDIAVAVAHTAEAAQHAMIATPVRLVRPRNTISAMTSTKASAHPE